MSRAKILRLLIVSGIVMILDQITKLVVVANIEFGRDIPVIPEFFNLTHVLNPGGAFGLFAQHSAMVRIMFFLVFSLIAVGFILYIYVGIPETHPMLANGMSLIFGGAIGNLIDRVRMGKVVDFLDVYLGNMHWPAFNIADSAICIGVGVFVYHILFNKMPAESKVL
jgi:signal peptidase II